MTIERSPTLRLAIVVSPHPDDEMTPGGSLRVLRCAGWRVINVAAGLGRPGQHERRRAELERACAGIGFELDCVEPPLAMSRGDDLDAAGRTLAEALAERFSRLAPDVVVSPGPEDSHHAHELVARAVRDAVVRVGRRQSVWWYEGWGFLRRPTLLVDVEPHLDIVCRALAEHEGELARNDYASIVRARSAVAAVLGPERVFGFGAQGGQSSAAEILCETIFADDDWRYAAPRWLDPEDPSTGVPSDVGAQDLVGSRGISRTG